LLFAQKRGSYLQLWQAIALAQEISATYLVLDDGKARKLAERLGLPVIGTVCIAIAAPTRGLSPLFCREVRKSCEEWIEINRETR